MTQGVLTHPLLSISITGGMRNDKVTNAYDYQFDNSYGEHCPCGVQYYQVSVGAKNASTGSKKTYCPGEL